MVVAGVSVPVLESWTGEGVKSDMGDKTGDCDTRFQSA